MIISHLHKFIFFKTRKTAGTSIEIALASVCGPDDIITGLNPEGLPKGYAHPVRNTSPQLQYGHASAETVCQHISQDVWHSYTKIASIRNPWDRVVSMYWFRKQEPDWKNWSFAAFVDNFATGGALHQNGLNIPSHCAFLKTKTESTLTTDILIRFEYLWEDMDTLSKRLNVHLPTLPHAKGEYRKSKGHYSSYYDDYTRDLIASRYADDIERFQFSFAQNTHEAQ